MNKVIAAGFFALSLIATASFAADKKDVLTVRKDDVVLGDPKAPYTMFEYASLTCNHCAHFHNNVLPELQKKYIDTGKLKLVLRNFPLNAPALKAAQLVACAGPEKGATFTKVLFEIQDRWAFDEGFEAALVQIGTVGGMDPKKAEQCLKDPVLEKKILEGRQEAADVLQLKATPSFFIKDQEIQGAVPIEQFSAVIDSIIAAGGK